MYIGTRKKKKLRENKAFPNIREIRNAGKVIGNTAGIFQIVVGFSNV